MSTEAEPKKREVKFEGNFITAEDLYGKGVVEVEIASVSDPRTEKDATGRLIDKHVISFKGASKRFIANTTCMKVIKSQHGGDLTGWVGKKIGLETRWIKEAFGERNLPVVRVHADNESQLGFKTRKNYGIPRPFTEEELRSRR